MSGEYERASRLTRRLQARRAAHRRRGIVYRTLFTLAGLAVLATGVAMLVLPGPALVVIPIGLAMLSLEFGWAGRALDHTLAYAEETQKRARETTRAERVLGVIAALLAVGAVVAAALLWDIPLLPF